jgi:ribosomal-protein-alanine N-acetyltransferase
MKENTMDVSIHLLKKENTKEILEFEKENKDFFETVIPPRSDDYFDLDNLRSIIGEIEEEQNKGLCHMYLIRDKDGNLVGRVNLFFISRGIYEKAEIGYRIGEKYMGKGYGTKAVKLACNEAFKVHKLHRIEAGTGANNVGSQIVLIKNGFEFIGRTRDVIKLNGKWEDGLLFERIKKE